MLRPFRLYASFGGRACRDEQWKFSLLVLTMMICAGLVGLLLLTLPILLATVTPLAAVTVRRLHDTGRTGLWLLLPLSSLVLLFVLALISVMSGSRALGDALPAAFMLALATALAVLAVLCALPGTSGPNRFGPDPLEDAALSAEGL